MLHYLLANNQTASPVFEWIERAAVFIEVLAVEMKGRWPWQPPREGHLLPAIEAVHQEESSDPKTSAVSLPNTRLG